MGAGAAGGRSKFNHDGKLHAHIYLHTYVHTRSDQRGGGQGGGRVKRNVVD